LISRAVWRGAIDTRRIPYFVGKPGLNLDLPGGVEGGIDTRRIPYFVGKPGLKLGRGSDGGVPDLKVR